MLINSITLQNFRQFKQKQKIEFSTNPNKNITIIHGENGSGKTTLLQAFLWCFYGDSAVNFTRKDMLINKSVEITMNINSDAIIEVSVEFLHENIYYCITRKHKVRKELNEKIRIVSTEFKIMYLDANGNYREYTKESPDNFVDRIFTERLSSYFFFDGERIKDLGDNSRNGRKDLSTAVSNILGLDILQNGKRHVVKVKNQFEREQVSKYDDNTIQNINDEMDRIKEKIEIYTKQQEELKEELEDVEKDIIVYSDKLKNFRQSKELQQKREKLQKRIEIQNLRIIESRERIFKSFSDKAYIFFAQQLFDKVTNILSKYEVKDKCIEGINGKAIDFILKRQRCFCGRELKEGCPEYKVWMDMKKYLPPQSFGVMINSFIRETKSKSSSIKDFVNEVNRENESFLREQDSLIALSDELAEINKSLSGIDNEAILKTEQTYRERKERHREISQEKLPNIKANILNAEQNLKKLEEKRKNFIVFNQKNMLLERRINICRRLENKFQDYYNEREEVIREKLSNKVKETFSGIIHKDYSIEIDEKYRFDVVDENSITVPMSEGEKQVTSLSFISGIIDIARDKELNRMLAKKSGYDATEIYPLVMDSPFGSLDSGHRKNVANIIPRLSEQIIIFASSTQWQGEVEEELKGIVGKSYSLEYHKISEDGISVEYTEIRKVGD